MEQNESNVDRMIRAVVGGILLIVGLFVLGETAGGVILDILGVVLLVTSALGFCPLYKLFNFSTKK